MHFLCFCSSCFDFFFVFALHLLLAIIVIATWCAMSFLALCYCYLAWCVVPCLVLLLFIIMYGPNLATLQLFVVVRHPLHYVVATYRGASSFTLHCCYLLSCIAFTVHCCCCLLWFVVTTCVVFRHLFCIAIAYYSALLSPCIIVICCGLSPSPYITTILCYGSSSFALWCWSMLWCALHYYWSLCIVIPHLVWFVAPCFVLLLHHSMLFPGSHVTFPCVVVICCGSSLFALCYYLLVEVMYSLFLPCVGFKRCEVSCVVFFIKNSFKSFVGLFWLCILFFIDVSSFLFFISTFYYFLSFSGYRIFIFSELNFDILNLHSNLTSSISFL